MSRTWAVTSVLLEAEKKFRKQLLHFRNAVTVPIHHGLCDGGPINAASELAMMVFPPSFQCLSEFSFEDSQIYTR